jgi:prepilin-type N-terminal cleavage/methylation domain-containing protein
MRQKGFTIVELLIVIVVIGILATVAYVNYQGVQAQARDTERIAEVQAIGDAIKLYRLKNGNDIQTGSGCGGNGGGGGWFAYENGTTYVKSIMKCLQEAGYLDGEMIDPSNCTTTSIAAPGKTCRPVGYTYMKYTCTYQGQTISIVYARLETQDNTSQLTSFDGGLNTCNSNTVATSYGMNYMLIVD